MKCDFYTDDHVAASLSRCSTHGAHPITCATRLQHENEIMLEALNRIVQQTLPFTSPNSTAASALKKVSELK
jgi:hypothetical protein